MVWPKISLLFVCDIVCVHVQVTGSFAGIISLRLTPGQRSSVDVSSVLETECSHVFRSHTPPKSKPQTRTIQETPPEYDSREGAKAMLLDIVQKNHPNLDGAGVKIGEPCHSSADSECLTD